MSVQPSPKGRPESGGGLPSASIVIPAYRSSDTLALIFQALQDQEGVDNCEIVVVDDGSMDGTADVARDALETLRLTGRVIEQSNQGPAAARNRGVAEARHALLIFLDSDVVPLEGFLPAHLGFHLNHPDLHFVLVGPYRSATDSPKTDFRSWLDEGHSSLISPPWHQISSGDVSHAAFLTGNLSLKKEMLDRVGGFDPSFPVPAFEDVEMGSRLARAGMTLHFDESAAAVHMHPLTPEKLLDRMASIGYSAHMFQERSRASAPIPPPPPASRIRRGTWRILSVIGRLIGSRRLRFGYYAIRLHDEFVKGFHHRAQERSSGSRVSSWDNEV